MRAAAQARYRRARTELHAFDGGDGVQSLRQAVFHPAEGRLAQPGRQPQRAQLHRASQAVARIACRVDGGQHARPSLFIQHRRAARSQQVKDGGVGHQRVKGRVLFLSHAQ